jgi:hypothetical protein
MIISNRLLMSVMYITSRPKLTQFDGLPTGKRVGLVCDGCSHVFGTDSSSLQSSVSGNTLTGRMRMNDGDRVRRAGVACPGCKGTTIGAGGDRLR